MSKVDSNLDAKGAEILSDDVLKGIAAGLDGNSAEFGADLLLAGLTGEKGGFTFENGYTSEEVAACFKAGMRGLKPKETPAA